MRHSISAKNRDTILPLLMVCAIFFSLSFFSLAMAADDTVSQSSPKTDQNHVILNMVDTDISVLIETISQMTGKTFIIDSNVKGKINVVSNETIPVDKAYAMFESVLEVNGFALVPSGDAIKVVPATEARTKNIETRVKADDTTASNPEDSFITQIISLKYADAKSVKTLFTSLVSKSSVVLPYEDTNSLIILDTKSNIQRLMHILKTIDVPGSGREISVRPLSFADAQTLTQKLSTLFKTSMSEEKDVSQKTLLFVADERTNSIIFVASEEDTARIEQLIALLDRDIPKGKGKIQVKRLMNADAKEMAEVLQNLSTGATGSTQDGAKETVFIAGDLNITADAATNSLIIMADSADYAVIEEIIDSLDTPRAMVYIQAVIMEVSVDKAFELGIEWNIFDETSIDGKSSVVGGGFSASNGLDATELLTSNGLSLGVLSGSLDLETTYGTYTIPNIGALIKALQTNEDVNLLSKPNLTTQDNKEASIVVGKNVPYQTRTSTTDNDTYNSYDYKDVGITLKITPHISQNRNVRLEISFELTALPGSSEDISITPTTLKRSVETTVNVQDQQMLVIGGLIDDTLTNSTSRVPLLGSIPILGRLFRYDSKVGNKTNLYVFISPRVVQNSEEAAALTSEIQDTIPETVAGRVSLYTPSISEENMTPPATHDSAN